MGDVPLMWHILQAIIIFAVVASNLYWEWTPNGHLAALIGIGLSFAVTAGLTELAKWWRRSARVPYRPPSEWR